MSNKQKTIIGLMVVIIALSGAYFIFRDSAPKQIYEVAVMVRSQDNPNKAEDMKTSLKKGDVLVVQKDEHNWSKTESISYLILNMNLTEEQSQLLSKAKTRELGVKELSEVEREQIDKEKKRAEEEGRDYVPERREETLIAREYRIDMTDFVEDGFKAVDLISGQPYLEEIYDWSIVERKK
jgi:hypothetical protein